MAGTRLSGSCHSAAPASAAVTWKMERLRGMWKSLVTTARRLREHLRASMLTNLGIQAARRKLTFQPLSSTTARSIAIPWGDPAC